MSFFKTAKNLLGIEIERPPYEIIEKLADNIEIRKYAASKWVCTSVNTEASNLVNNNNGQRSTMFNKLFKYITGQNERQQKIAMTSPVTFDFQKNDADLITEQSNLKMSMRFYVPKEHQANTPQPTGDAFLQDDPESTFAVIRFGGYASITDYIRYRDMLIQRLGDQAKSYDLVNMMAAGYDPPFKPIGRTNEVWLRKIA